MKKTDKIIIIFYIFLASSFIVSIGIINSTYSDLPTITKILPSKITEIKFEKNVQVNKEKLFNVMINVEDYPKILPKNILSVKVLEQTNSVIIAEEEISESGIKTKIIAKHEFVPYEKHVIEIIEGDAKGTKIIQTFTGNETMTSVSNQVILDLKGVFLPVAYLPEKNFMNAMNTVITNFATYAEGFDSKFERDVDNVYREILKRPADPEGLTHYSFLLENEKITIEDIRKDLLESNENKMKDVTELEENTKKMINQIYFEILYRNADEIGLAYYGTLFENGEMTADEIRKDISNSDEGINTRINTSVRKSIDAIHIELFGTHIDQKNLIYYEELLLKQEISLDEIREDLLSKIIVD